MTRPSPASPTSERLEGREDQRGAPLSRNRSRTHRVRIDRRNARTSLGHAASRRGGVGRAPDDRPSATRFSGRVTGCAVRRSKIQGDGVFARKPFHMGEVVLEVDVSDTVKDCAKLTLAQEVYIDVFIAADGTERTTWMKTPEKLVNHSWDPNIVVQTDIVTGIRRMVALREIHIGDENTWDYALNIWQKWIGPVRCNCRARTCRRMIQGNFFTLPDESRRKLIPRLDEPFKRRFAKELSSMS